jgi:Spy/CpxP family protein refolding chaperone
MNPKLLLAASLLLSVPAFAQDATPPPPSEGAQSIPGGPPRVKGMRGPGAMSIRGGKGGSFGVAHTMEGGMRGPEAGILPPGIWWKNPELTARIGLSPDQQKRIEDTFMQSRIQLIHLHASIEEEQLKLEPLLNANPIDQGKALAQINNVADLRADMEKANAKMLLSIRGVLSADQWTKLQADHHQRGGMDGGHGDPGMMRGPHSQTDPGMMMRNNPDRNHPADPK